MKTKMLLLLGLILVLGLLLTGCAQGLAPASWPGITAPKDGSLAYVAAGASVYAVNLADGTQAWSFPEKPSAAKLFLAAPVLTSDGQLIVGGFDHGLYSLDPATGTINWEFKNALDRYIGSVLVANDMIYAPNADYKVYALDMMGNLKWTAAAKQSIWGAPVFDGNTLYVGSLDRRIYAFNGDDGTELWKTDVGGAVLSSPVTDQDNPLFVTTFSGELLALDKANGEIIWRLSFDDRIWSSPVMDGGYLYFGDNQGTIHAVEIATRTEIWNKSVGSPILGAPLVTTEAIIFGTEAGNLYAFARDGSKKIWEQGYSADKVTVNLYGSPVLAGEYILIAPQGGTSVLVALDQNGSEIWPFTPVKK